MLLKFGDQKSVGLKPFRFQSMWINDDYFLSVVFSAWKIQVLGNTLLQVMLRLKQVKQSLRNWNKDIFGDLKSRLSAAQQHLSAAQNDISFLGFTKARFERNWMLMLFLVLN